MRVLSSSHSSANTLVVAVTSGKGGVGKTLTTVNFAVAARRMGKSVLILDGDLGLANVDVVLGLQPRYNIRDVLDGNAELEDIIVEGPLGIAVIPSGSGVASLTRLSYLQQQHILDQLGRVKDRFDLLLIDTGAGISDTVQHLNKVSDLSLVVTTPEPHALTDAFGLMKVLRDEHSMNSFELLMNQVKSEAEGLKVAERFAEVAGRFLDIRVAYAGSVPFDTQVQKAVMQRKAASEQSTFTLAGQAWTQIARRILAQTAPRTGAGRGSEFWHELVSGSVRKQAAF